MLKSMTGYGRAEGETALGKVFVETRSVNHRYSDINIKLPKRLASFETRIKELIRSHVSRGRIDVSLKINDVGRRKDSTPCRLPSGRTVLPGPSGTKGNSSTEG